MTTAYHWFDSDSTPCGGATLDGSGNFYGTTFRDVSGFYGTVFEIGPLAE